MTIIPTVYVLPTCLGTLITAPDIPAAYSPFLRLPSRYIPSSACHGSKVIP
ncbi:hypothetical protein [Gardnerella sp. KA00747]|uniref:hypothetical protein n=1 Tax=Gardnerella sp. KA00747 TaxID=2749078 RepID=UPI003BACDE71